MKRRIIRVLAVSMLLASNALWNPSAALGADSNGSLTIEDICNAMYRQYPQFEDLAGQELGWVNGEPSISMIYGEVPGQDYISYLWLKYQPEMADWKAMTKPESFGSKVAWDYCYGIIGMANAIIDASGENSTEESFKCAQALTLRAHAYLRLAQIYGPRWDDRLEPSGQEAPVVPLVISGSTENLNELPLASLSVVINQIYADLDRAISLYETSGMKRVNLWEPDISVCKGIYARAALLCNDYRTAQNMAREAREGYTLMSADDYLSGFAEPTSEWMWCDNGNVDQIYYWSFGALYACNGAYPCLWGNIGAGAIDNDLLEMASVYDRRAMLYFGPSNVLATKDYFWSEYVAGDALNINSTVSPLHKDFVDFASKRYQETGAPKGWPTPYTLDGLSMNQYTTSVTAQFGAQFKFWGSGEYSSSYFPFMRASEMLLTEAEAAWRNYDEATARTLIDQLNVERSMKRSNGESYYRNIESSGDELLADIKFYRRLELWGEGFSWFDFKRWNESIVRRQWIQKNEKSGNWPAPTAGTFSPKDYNGWRWAIPSQRNPMVDGVNAIGADSGRPCDIYTLDGVCVKRDASREDIDALAPGFYIVGGRKMIIK